MLITAGIFVATLPIKIMVLILSVFAFFIPSYMNTAIIQVLGNSGFVGSILPMQAHPGLHGLAGVTGLMPIVGFVLTLAGYIVIIKLVIFFIKMIISVMPWNTHQVKHPNNLAQ